MCCQHELYLCHTCANIAAVLLSSVNESGIPSNPPLVTDNASNMSVPESEAGCRRNNDVPPVPALPALSAEDISTATSHQKIDSSTLANVDSASDLSTSADACIDITDASSISPKIPNAGIASIFGDVVIVEKNTKTVLEKVTKKLRAIRIRGLFLLPRNHYNGGKIINISFLYYPGMQESCSAYQQHLALLIESSLVQDILFQAKGQ
ncbi:hypothetical protein CHS0354_004352 [Potamilus streckersoni]|uniref:Uncharacterized protein n=1 Tax=Potamilus streckersoni TaxID=2493646 RepID=A0AAE0VW28_9BIVA|nr:hypothetical protein CHS0354_004352 [Potamilus streckersoni]